MQLTEQEKQAIANLKVPLTQSGSLSLNITLTMDNPTPEEPADKQDAKPGVAFTTESEQALLARIDDLEKNSTKLFTQRDKLIGYLREMGAQVYYTWDGEFAIEKMVLRRENNQLCEENARLKKVIEEQKRMIKKADQGDHARIEELEKEHTQSVLETVQLNQEVEQLNKALSNQVRLVEDLKTFNDNQKGMIEEQRATIEQQLTDKQKDREVIENLRRLTEKQDATIWNRVLKLNCFLRDHTTWRVRYLEDGQMRFDNLESSIHKIY